MNENDFDSILGQIKYSAPYSDRGSHDNHNHTSSLDFEKNNMVLIRFGLLVFIAVVYVEYCIGTWET